MWGVIEKDDKALTEDDAALLDEAAALARSDNDLFERVRALYEGDERLRVPAVIHSYFGPEPITVRLF